MKNIRKQLSQMQIGQTIIIRGIPWEYVKVNTRYFETEVGTKYLLSEMVEVLEGEEFEIY